MPIFSEYSNYDGVGLAELIRKKDISAIDALDSAIDLIERLNPKLNAVHRTMYHYATESINRNQNMDGIFAGIPMLLKDMDSSLANYPMMQGSNYLKDTVMPYDNYLTKSFRQSGALICGKSATPEYGLAITTEPLAFGATRNPWDTNKSTGGSSGGAASAVSSRMVPFAHASDGGGSIRIPAASCGLVGLKPNRARTSFGPSHGDKWGGLTHSGIVSRTVRDTAYMYDHLFSTTVGDPYSVSYEKGSLIKSLEGKQKFKIGVNQLSRTGLEITEEAKKAIQFNAKLCEDLGHDVEEMEFTHDGLLAVRCFVVIICSHVNQMFNELKDVVGRSFKKSEVETATRLFSYLGKSFRASDYTWARYNLQKIARQIMEDTDKYDIVLTPIISQPPPNIGELRPNKQGTIIGELIQTLKLGFLFKNTSLRDAFLDRLAPESLWYAPDAMIQNITGQPSISVPTYWTKDNLPLGVQFASRYAEEDKLINLAMQLEESAPWIQRKPNI
tara:strand:+ start:2979 stop:4481 length:1503 start_codon:yes stop_codon:yes gene_type:complete